MISAPHALPAPEGFWFLDNHCLVRLAAGSNPDRLSMLEFRLPRDAAPPLHVHQDEDEIFQVIEGRVRLQVGSQVREIGPGEVVLAPRAIPHGFRVISPEGARMTTLTRGGGFERMVRSMSRPADGVRLPDQPVTPEMAEKLDACCAAERITLLGPPIA